MPRLVDKPRADAVNHALDAIFSGSSQDIDEYLAKSLDEMAEDMARYDSDLDDQDPVDLMSYIAEYLRNHAAS